MNNIPILKTAIFISYSEAISEDGITEFAESIYGLLGISKYRKEETLRWIVDRRAPQYFYTSNVLGMGVNIEYAYDRTPICEEFKDWLPFLSILDWKVKTWIHFAIIISIDPKYYTKDIIDDLGDLIAGFITGKLGDRRIFHVSLQDKNKSPAEYFLDEKGNVITKTLELKQPDPPPGYPYNDAQSETE